MPRAFPHCVNKLHSSRKKNIIIKTNTPSAYHGCSSSVCSAAKQQPFMMMSLALCDGKMLNAAGGLHTFGEIITHSSILMRKKSTFVSIVSTPDLCLHLAVGRAVRDNLSLSMNSAWDLIRCFYHNYHSHLFCSFGGLLDLSIILFIQVDRFFFFLIRDVSSETNSLSRILNS